MKLDTIKGIVSFAGSMCVGSLVSMIAKNNVMPANMYEKVVVGVGSFILSDMVSSKAGNYIDSQFDVSVKQLKEIKNVVEQEQEAAINVDLNTGEVTVNEDAKDE